MMWKPLGVALGLVAAVIMREWWSCVIRRLTRAAPQASSLMTSATSGTRMSRLRSRGESLVILLRANPAILALRPTLHPATLFAYLMGVADPGSTDSPCRLTPEELSNRNKRIKRAMDISLKHSEVGSLQRTARPSAHCILRDVSLAATMAVGALYPPQPSRRSRERPASEYCLCHRTALVRYPRSFCKLCALRSVLQLPRGTPSQDCAPR
jgi:hypothetical protein